MKVTTEGCILGAVVELEGKSNILDIGTGTGLLSLMMAQRCEAAIDCVEIDADAATQAKINFRNSPWSERISLYETSIQNFESPIKYDLIVSNPPFFRNHLPSSDEKRNKALHDNLLGQDELLENINRLLAETGTAYILYPEHESKAFEEKLSRFGLCVLEKLIITNQPGGRTFRVIQKLGRKNKSTNVVHLSIRQGQSYTEQFKSLLKDYYLAL